MSTLFLIGNGFDVNCGMKTKYTDVYENYINQPPKTDNLKKFKSAISGDLENWSDFEMEMGRYAERLSTEEEFIECVIDFSAYMRRYLETEEGKFAITLEHDEIYDAVVEEVDNSIKTFYRGFSPNVDRAMEERAAGNVGGVEVISFNYTTMLDRILISVYQNNGYRPKSPIHIHGTLSEGPVVGVDNVDQICARFGVTKKGLRAFVKPIFNQQFDQLRIKQTTMAIDRANTICAHGMSFGDSDLSWRNKIIDWLKKEPFRRLFVYEYELRDKTYIMESEMMDIEDDAKEKLLTQWGVNIDDPVFNQIHIPCGRNIFNIDDAIKGAQHRIEIRERTELAERIRNGKKFVDDNLAKDSINE